MKTCLTEGCERKCFSHGRCDWHQYERTDSKWLEKQRKTVWKKPRQASSKVYQIPKVSKKMSFSLKIYHGRRIVFLAENPMCSIKVDGCTKYASQVHHGKGRVGKLLLDTKWWIPTCDNCHRWAEENPKEAKEKGVSVSRLAK